MFWGCLGGIRPRMYTYQEKYVPMSIWAVRGGPMGGGLSRGLGGVVGDWMARRLAL